MKKLAIVVFVKTPGHSPIKTRLAAGIGKERAEQFYLKSLAHTETKLLEFKNGQSDIDLYWSVAEPKAYEDPLWKNFRRMGQGKGGLGDRLDYVYSALQKNYEYVFLLGADSPHMPVAAMTEALAALEDKQGDYVMGRTDDGGFYLFASGQPIEKQLWKSVPYSCEQTADKLEEKLRQKGRVFQVSGLFDIDTLEDLRKLAEIDSQYAQFLP